jgi:ubiquinone/menaquinone biosynthesis C-methylase UbiE
VSYLQEAPLVDVGVGTGIGFSSVMQHSPIVGVDGAIEMLRIATKLVNAHDAWRSKISLVCADATSLPFRNQIFPSVVSITVLQNLSDRKTAVEELLRIVRSQGTMAITALAKSMSIDDVVISFKRIGTPIVQFKDLANEDVGFILRVNR